jgi:hypothetical protein
MARLKLGFAADTFMPEVTGGLAVAVLKHLIGHNWQVNSLVFGVEGELGYNDADGSNFVVPSP